MSNDSNDKSRQIPDSDTKTDRGSKSVHSELDESNERGWQPEAEEEE